MNDKPGVPVRTYLELHLANYLGRREASVMVLLPGEPPDDAWGVAQFLSGGRAAEESQHDVGADLHRQRSWRLSWPLIPVKEASCKTEKGARLALHERSTESKPTSPGGQVYLPAQQHCSGDPGEFCGSVCLLPVWRRTPSGLWCRCSPVLLFCC